MARRPQIANRFSPLREALHALVATGADGFEGLVTTLIDAITEGRLRLLQSGTQGGGDGVSDEAGPGPRRGMQSKRYGLETKLTAVGLSGELTEAVNTYPGLDVWIVPATRNVAGQPFQSLTRTARREGIACIAIDWAPGAVGIPRLLALCAAAPDRTRHWLSANLVDELTAWAAEPEIAAAIQDLRGLLTAVDVGFANLTAASSARLEAIFADPATANSLVGPSARFLEAYPPVEREALALSLQERLLDQSFVALVGPEGVGKTWISLGALRTSVASGQQSIACIVRGITAGRYGDVIDAAVASLVDLGERANMRASDPAAFWRRRLELWAASPSTAQSLLVLVDGLDEAQITLDWTTWLAPALEARWSGLFRVLVTSRPMEWERLGRLATLTPTPSELAVGSFTDAERDTYLRAHNIDPNHLKADVSTAAKHPRTAFHIVRLKADLPDVQRLTREQLLLADFKHFREATSPSPLTDLHFKALVAQFGSAAREQAASQAVFTALPGDAISAAEALSGLDRSQLRPVLSELIDGRWWEGDPAKDGQLRFKDDALPDAVGLALSVRLRREPPAEARRCAEAFLEPWGADDLSERILRMCAAALILDRSTPDTLCREMLELWFTRPHRSGQEDFWWRLHAVRPGLFLDFCAELGGRPNDWFLTWSVAKAWSVFQDIRPLIETRLANWLLALPPPRNHPDWPRELNRERRTHTKRAALLQRKAPELLGRYLAVGADHENHVILAIRVLQFLPRAELLAFYVHWAMVTAASGRRAHFDLMAWLWRRGADEAALTALRTAALSLQADTTQIAREAGSLLLEATGLSDDFDAASTPLPEPQRITRLELVPTGGRSIVRRKVAETAADNETRALLLELAPLATDTQVDLDAALKVELDRRLGLVTPAQVANWLELSSVDYLLPLARWAPGQFCSMVIACAQAPETHDAEFEKAVYIALPFLDGSQRAELQRLARERLQAAGDAGPADLTNVGLILVLANAPFATQFSRLLEFRARVPEGTDALINGASKSEVVAALAMIEKANIEVQPTYLDWVENAVQESAEKGTQLDFDWRTLLKSESAAVRAAAMALALRLGPASARQWMLESGWRADQDSDQFCRFTGSQLLVSDPPLPTDQIIDRIGPEFFAVLVKEDRDAGGKALDGIFAWAEREVTRTGGRSYGGRLLHFVGHYQREIYDAVVGKAPDRMAAFLEQACATTEGMQNFSFYLDGPLPGLLQAAARRGLPSALKLWRSMMEADGRWHRNSLIDELPAWFPEGEDFDLGRDEMIARCDTDERLASAVGVCLKAGREPYLVAKISKDLSAPSAFVRARAITMAGFLEDSASARALWEGVLAEPLSGWLGRIHAAALRTWRDDIDATAWRKAMFEAEDEGSAAAHYRLWSTAADARDNRRIPDIIEERRWRRAWINRDREARGEAMKKRTKERERTIAFSDPHRGILYWRFE